MKPFKRSSQGGLHLSEADGLQKEEDSICMSLFMASGSGLLLLPHSRYLLIRCLNELNEPSLTKTLCLQVCVHHGTIYPVGQFWEEGCDMCTCTDMEDTVMGLRVAQCAPKPCEESCRTVSKMQELVSAWGLRGGSRGGDVRKG